MFLPCRPCCGGSFCKKSCSSETYTIRCSVTAADYTYTVTRTSPSPPYSFQFQFIWYGSDFNGTLDLTGSPYGYYGRTCGGCRNALLFDSSSCKFVVRIQTPVIDNGTAACAFSPCAYNIPGGSLVPEETDLLFRCDTGVGSYDCSRVARLGTPTSTTLVSLEDAYSEYASSSTPSYVSLGGASTITLFGSARVPASAPTITGSKTLTITSADYV